MEKKRRRDADHERKSEEKEYEARGVSVVNLSRPPWVDEYTEEQLSPEEVAEAMAIERAFLVAFHMSRDASEAEKKLIDGKEEIDCRWLLHRKPATKKVKASLIARQRRLWEIVFYWPISRIRSTEKKPYTALFGNVKTAVLHADLSVDERVYIRLSMTERLDDQMRSWVAQKALYGFRQTLRLFQEHLAAVAQRPSWVRCNSYSMVFRYRSQVGTTDAFMSVFADDLLI
eukprot:463095-Heterocapsa_arctica.AAC.1